MSESIERWRAAIDAVDEELLRLLNERARLAAKVAELKVSGELPLRDCERESAVLLHIRRANRGPGRARGRQNFWAHPCGIASRSGSCHREEE